MEVVVLYSVDGDFGKVRLVSRLDGRSQSGFFSLAVVGWHSCNDLYHIHRPDGIDMPLLLYTVGGCGDLRIGSHHYTLYPGSIAVIPRGTPTAYGVPTGGQWEFYWLHVCGEPACRFLEQALAHGSFHAASANSDYPQRFEALLRLSREYSFDTELRISQKLSSLLHLVATDLQPGQHAATLSQRAQDYIQEHFREPLTIEAIAQALFVSGAHLIRVLKQETGQTPHQFLLDCRLRAAAQLLQFSELTCAEIAGQVGFSSASHFISSFRQHRHITPQQFREQHR